MATVKFSASGYGTERQRYRNRELAEAAVRRECEEMAVDHGLGEDAVSRFGDEWVLQSDSGEEIARWEIF